MALRFGQQRALEQERRDRERELTIQARAIIGVDTDTVASVSEHACGDAGCARPQTVILVMRPNERTKALRIDKPLAEVTFSDLSEALAPIVAGGHPNLDVRR